MIINESKYLRFDTPRISNRQISTIQNNYDTIQKEVIVVTQLLRKFIVKYYVTKN